MSTVKKYYIRLEEGEKVSRLRRTNRGFSPHELLGLLFEIQMDIIQQLKGNVKPTLVERKVIL